MTGYCLVISVPSPFFVLATGAASASGGSVSYTTWNPADSDNSYSFTNGDLTSEKTAHANTWDSFRGAHGKSSGKWYFEITIDVTGSPNQIMLGVGTSSATLTNYLGSDANGYGYYGPDGDKYNNASAAAYGAAFTTASDIISVALDMDNGKIWWGKNGTWQNSGDPGAGTGEAFSGLSGTFFPMGSIRNLNNKITANFGATAFSHTVPTGFTSGWTQ